MNRLYITILCGALACAPAFAADAALRHAQALLDRVPLVDGHNDLPWTIREDAAHPMDVDHYDLRRRTPHETDLARLKQGKLSAQFDLSHVSTEVMQQALDTSAAPVIFSHSSARALDDHPRNVPDEVLKRLPANGGVAMVTFVPAFVSPQVAAWGKGLGEAAAAAGAKPDSPEFKAVREAYIARAGPQPKATLSMVADHIEHVARVADKDHVGIAGDYYGSLTSSSPSH